MVHTRGRMTKKAMYTCPLPGEIRGQMVVISVRYCYLSFWNLFV